MLKKIWEFLKRIIWGKDLVVYKIRKYLRKLYEGYPSHAFYGGYDNDVRDGLVVLQEDGVVAYAGTDRQTQSQQHFRLTAEGLRLVEIWNTERLTFFIILLTLLEILLIINFI